MKGLWKKQQKYLKQLGQKALASSEPDDLDAVICHRMLSVGSRGRARRDGNFRYDGGAAHHA